MGKTVDALKVLDKKCNTSQTEPTGKTISTEGAVTGGVATLSNGSTVEITVTTTPAS